MRIGMIANAMTLIQYTMGDARMILHVLANEKESCFGLVSAQLCQYPICYLRGRAIIKGEIDDLLFGLVTP